MPCEAHLHIFSIKSIFLLKNVTIHENSIKGLKIPRPPAVPVQARLRVPGQKSRCRPVCDGFSCSSDVLQRPDIPAPSGAEPLRPRRSRDQANARPAPGLNTRWPRRRPPPGRCRHADAGCRKGCPASPARLRPARPEWNTVTRRVAFRSPPDGRPPPLRG